MTSTKSLSLEGIILQGVTDVWRELLLLNPFTVMMSVRNLKPSSFSVFVLSHRLMRGFSLKGNRKELKVDVLWDRKIHCLQARPCIIQPGDFTGWSGEGVKKTAMNSGDHAWVIRGTSRGP